MDPMQDVLLNLDLFYKVIEGDEVAAKLYVGSYILITTNQREYFRFKGDDNEIPKGYYKADNIQSLDNDGFLLLQYWSLPRINPQGEIY